MKILIDLSYLAHRAMHAVGNLESEDMPTGVLFGFFEQLYSICSSPRFASNQVLLFSDSKKSYRTRTYPKYKEKRRQERSPEEIEQRRMMYQQVDLLVKKVLPRVGFPVYNQVGLESDDLIAWTAKELTRKEKRGVIITADGDLYQSISEYISWYDPMRDLLYTPKSFKKAKGITHEKWGMVKALGGCGSDNVPGIRGVSEKSAIQYLLGTLPEHYKKYQDIKQAEADGTLARWKRLVILPHSKTRPLHIKKAIYTPKEFFSFCKKYEIYSFLQGKKKRQWEMFFEGEFFGIPRRRK